MDIRKSLVCTAVVVAVAASSDPAAQDAPAERTFRSRVDLITVDVVAVDSQGRPIEDLRDRDFSVKVDGKSRPVVAAQLVKVDRSSPAELSVDPADTLVSTNVGAESGRRVAIAVDQTLITPGSIISLMRAASRFVDALAPRDYAAVLAFPEPGPRVDFTIDKARVREAMQGIVGQPAKNRTTTFNLSLQEAQQIDASERGRVDMSANSADGLLATVGLTTRRVLERGCRGQTLQELLANLDELKQCVRDLGSEAMVDVQDMRTDTTFSLRRLESFLKELAALDGPKSMILVSAGLVADDRSLVEEVAKLAADARTTIHVVAVDRERERDRTDLPNGQSAMTLQDRAFEMQGLETLTDRTGGGLYRAIGPAAGVFDRLSLELSASYTVAVERRQGDPDRQRIEVDVKRRGVTLRSPRTVTAVSALNGRRPKEDLLREALASPLPVAGVPVRFSTFVRREPAAGRYRLTLAAQVGQPGAPGGDFDVGYAVIDERDRVVTSRANRVHLTASRSSEPPQYDAAVGLQPGVYSVRFAVVDSDGRRGTAVRRLTLPSMTGDALTTSDLIVGTSAVDGGLINPSVEPHVDGRLAAYLELYASESDQSRLTVNLEIAEGEASPPLTARTLNIGPGAESNWRVASGALDAAFLPGRYVARATVRRGGVQVRVVSRPFVLERSAVAPTAAPRATAVPLAADARARTARYVNAFVRGLSNVVGQEDFVLAGPARRVTSDFLLVRHPTSEGDLLTFRDVTHVNGVAVPNRQERLADLFLKPIDLAGDRVRQIAMAAEQHVPSVLNPIFVLAFLQADFQRRFELTVSDAGREWPATVKAAAFVEVGRPTILRGGPAGDLDVPVRGTAWIEAGTGRVLQTELLVNTGRTTTIVTRFALDRRLQIVVPEQMRTKNPDGVATYSNFRRFNVQTETTIGTSR